MSQPDDEDLRIRAYLGDLAARQALGDARPTRYDAVVRFVDHWFEKPLSESTLPKSEMDAWEEKLNVKLPSALREWCRLIGNRPDCQEAQNGVCTADMLAVAQRSYGIAVYCENQSNWEFYIGFEDFGEDDPVLSVT